MITKETLDKLTCKQRRKILLYKRAYNFNLYHLSLERLDTITVSATAYLQSMVDAEILTETEKKAIFHHIIL